MAVDKIRKRDGTVVGFQKEKIANAIFKAARAVGGKDRKIADELAEKIAAEVEKTALQGSVPAVEDVQDIVEKVLVESGHYKTAKAYILHRQKRAELRKEMSHALEKADIDEVDKKFDINALRVLKARYLRKDETGRLIETPKKLFTRIAVHTAIPNLFYDSLVFDITSQQKIHGVDRVNFHDLGNKFSIGSYKLNKYHIEAVWRLYSRFDSWGQMKVDFAGFLGLLESGKFNHYEQDIDIFFNLMAQKKFLPNTPAIANFGAMLGMGSACFHSDQPIITEDCVKPIKNVKVGDIVLTHRGKFRKVKEVFVRDTKSLLSIKCHKLPASTLLVTDEHPILAFRGGEANWYPAYSLTKNDYVALSHPVEIEDIKEIKIKDFVPEVQVDDEGNCFYTYEGGKFNAFTHVTKPVKNTVAVDYNLLKVFGFYLSEGCVSGTDCVRFTFSDDEREYCNEVVDIFKDKFGVEAAVEETNREDRKWLSLRFHSTILARFFLKVFGTGFNEKKIPLWILKLSVEKQKGLMEGMIKGDGTLYNNGTNINAKLVMCNQSLVYAFWQLCMRCGVFTSLGYETMPKLGTERPVRCQIGGREGTTLIEELYQRELQEEDTKFVTDNKVKNINGVTFTQVESIEKIAYDGPVYNFEVEEDHSYVANMVSAHNCFVLDVPDSIDGIMDTLKDASIIFKAGGGVGYNFSKLRPEGDFVSSTCGIASGPITFMTMFDKMTEVIKQGGIRRGANMGIININHPDIEKFIIAKDGNKQLKNFNISVLVMPDFWEYYNKNEPYPLRNPRTGEVVKTVNPRMLFDRVVYQAWESAEPGVIFYDRVNKHNPFFDHLGPIVTTNPCGEVLLYPNESCNLGSINVWSFAKEDAHGQLYFDWEGLKETVLLASRFLDNVIDVNKYPLQAIEDMTLATRKIGLGVMGVADLLYELKLPYNTDEGRKFMEKLMEFINYWSKVASIEMSKERGKMPYFDKSFYTEGRLPFAGFDDKDSWSFDWAKISDDIKKHGIRNGFTIVIAPTGSISMIAGCSSGIEPVYSLVFEKNVKVGSFYYVNHVFENIMKRDGLYDECLMSDICENSGSVQKISYMPADMKRVFITAMDTTPEDHIRALATFQKWVDSSISKTNNFPADATVEHMRESYILAYKLGCKDVTVFRDGSIKDQVLVSGGKKKESNTVAVVPAQTQVAEKPAEQVSAETIPAIQQPVSEETLTIAQTIIAEPPGLAQAVAVSNSSEIENIQPAAGELTNCPECSMGLVKKEGCLSCPECGWGLCK